MMSQDFTVPTGTANHPSEPSGFSTTTGTPSPTTAAPTGSPGTPGSTKDVAKEQAAGVGQSASEASRHVAAVAKSQASNVAAEAGDQAKDLLGRTRSELQEQAASQQQRVAAGIHSLSGELASMADRSDQSGTASELVRQAAQRADRVASWLDERDPGSLVQEVTSFARRRPGTFLAIAAGAGLIAGRLTQGAVQAAKSTSEPSRPSPTGGSASNGYTAAPGTTGGRTAGSATTGPVFADPATTDPRLAGTATTPTAPAVTSPPTGAVAPEPAAPVTATTPLVADDPVTYEPAAEPVIGEPVIGEERVRP
jgi:hypothetical protein